MSKLRLTGDTSGYIEIQAPDAAGSNTLVLPTSNGSANQFLRNGSTAGTLQYSSMVESGGNIGIGTTSVTQFSDYTTVQIDSSSSGSAIRLVDSTDTPGTDDFILYKNASGAYLRSASEPFIFYRSSELARFDGDGLKFNGDTAAANALDDYEEGSWTPTIVGSTAAGTVTYGVRNGKYTKIGRQVFIEVYVNYSSGAGGTGGLRITGLPFTVSSSGPTYPGLSIGYFDSISLTANTTPLSLFAAGNTYIYFYQIPSGGGTNIDIPWDGAGTIILAGCYTV